MQCLIHILSHEELQGIIIYDELKTLIRNYQTKEKILVRSLKVGIRYDLLSQEAFNFLKELKEVISGDEENGKKALDLREDVLLKIILHKDILDDEGKEMTAEVVEFETLMDHLFMKFQIRCPPMKT